MAVTTTFRQASPDEMAREISRCHAVIERYEADLARLRTALEFYAHRPHYAARTGMESAISRDHFGDRARSSLSPAPQPLEGAVRDDLLKKAIDAYSDARHPAVARGTTLDHKVGLLAVIDLCFSASPSPAAQEDGI